MVRSRSLAVVLLLVLTSAPVWAQRTALTPEQRQQALEHLESGKRKYNLGRFADAAEEFETVYALTGAPGFLFNIAQAYRFANVPTKALQFYKSYLREDSTANREEIERRITELQEIIAKQKQSSDAPPHGLQPDNGTETKVPENGGTPGTTATTNPSAAPQVAVAPTPQPAAGADDRAHRKTLTYAAYGMFGVAVVGLAFGGGMSGATVAKSNDVQSAASNHQVFTQSLADEQASGKLFSQLQIVGYVLGGAAAATGAVLLYFGMRHPPSSSRAQLLPSLGVGPDGAQVALTGRF